MKCPRCGFDAQNMKFCPECGMQMPLPQPVNPQNQNPYAPPAHKPVPNANPYAPPVQNQPRVVPVGQPAPHVTPMQSNARVTPMQSNARLVAQPPKSSNKGLLIAAIIIGAVVLGGIAIAVFSGLFYNRNLLTAGESDKVQPYKIEYQLK